MDEKKITPKDLLLFEQFLRQEERSAATIEKYGRDIRDFYDSLAGSKAVTKDAVLAYKQRLSEKYKAASANAKLVAVNRFLSFLQWDFCRVRLLKVQRRSFRDRTRELSKEEYLRLVRAAQVEKNERLALLLQALCSTGIRVSEHPFITVEAAQAGRVCIVCKGKERTVFLSPGLCRLVQSYCRRWGIVTGSVFVTRSGHAMNRSNIWAEMKALCQTAGVEPQKVFPHNLRHLFAVTYYQLEKDIVRLADILGHASVDTTRIYTCTSGEEHLRILSRLKLLL